MSYLVSARKWRPQKFEEIVGQDPIVRTLKNSLKNKRIASAYIFSGSRGVGKTTTARILAKGLNCKNGPTNEPCGICEPCVAIKNGSSLDVIEIDGASNRGIDNIRELKDNVKYAPSLGKYKIYIIDEIHMLTKEAFNALLKTLEEPPKHVVFIFATTEINKVPDTILSRCQWFDFKTLKQDAIAKQLEFIAQSDSVDIAKNYLSMIARNSEGSMRDAQMIFDQVISYSGGNIKEEDVAGILGLIDKRVLDDIFSAVIQKDFSKIVRLVALFKEGGGDIRVFYKELITYIRNVMLAKIQQEDITPEDMGLSMSEAAVIKEKSTLLSYDRIHSMFNIIMDAERNIKSSSFPDIILEMTLLKITQSDKIIPVDSVIEKIDNIQRLVVKRDIYGEKNISKRNENKEERPLPPNNKSDSNLKSTVLKGNEGAASSLNSGLKEGWNLFIRRIEDKKPSLPSVLQNVKITDSEDNKKIFICFNSRDSFSMDIAKRADNIAIISDTIKDIFGKDKTVELTIGSEETLEKGKTDSNINDIANKDIISDALDIFRGSIV